MDESGVEENLSSEYGYATYSPDLNPIENMWSKIKQIIRKLQYKCEDSYERIKAGFNSITSFDCQAYFRHFINI